MEKSLIFTRGPRMLTNAILTPFDAIQGHWDKVKGFIFVVVQFIVKHQLINAGWRIFCSIINLRAIRWVSLRFWYTCHIEFHSIFTIYFGIGFYVVAAISILRGLSMQRNNFLRLAKTLAVVKTTSFVTVIILSVAMVALTVAWKTL